MIRVLRHGDTVSVKNPVNGQEQVMVNVTFVEEGGRSGGDSQMSQTSSFLSEVAGEEVGLQNLRTHTHPVLQAKIQLFPLDKQFPGHINRGLYSTAQLRQQESVPPRMVDGKPTYFKTWIGRNPEDDADYRISNDVLAASRPDSVFGAQIGAAQVRVVSIDSRKGPQPNQYGEGNPAEMVRREPEVVASRTGS